MNEQTEHPFAEGNEIENQNIRITYLNLDRRSPNDKYPTIYKTHGDSSVTKLSLTPDEARFIQDQLRLLIGITPQLGTAQLTEKLEAAQKRIAILETETRAFAEEVISLRHVHERNGWLNTEVSRLEEVIANNKR